MNLRFSAQRHEYTDGETGVVIPHITGLLKDAGLIDDQWFTEEHSRRGTLVHGWTADYDLSVDPVIDPADAVHRSYYDAYVSLRGILQPRILQVEETLVHPTLRFAGRPDRVVTFEGSLGIWEIKTGGAAKSHPIQTALQSLLVSHDRGVPHEAIRRWCIYLTRRSTWQITEHKNPLDYLRAWQILAEDSRTRSGVVSETAGASSGTASVSRTNR